MFETEAEEIVKRNVCGDCNKCQSHGYICCDIYRYSRDSCLYGLRTGYNKAKVEVEDSYRESLCNSELNLASVTDRLEQAEEIIKEFMRITEMVEGFEPDYSELIAKAEALLKEEL